jgi:hypothetical protein
MLISSEKAEAARLEEDATAKTKALVKQLIAHNVPLRDIGAMLGTLLSTRPPTGGLATAKDGKPRLVRFRGFHHSPIPLDPAPKSSDRRDVGGVGDTEACPPKIRSCPLSSTAKPCEPPNGPELQPLIDHLREVAQGRDDIRVECAGILAGSWFSSGARRGEELIAAGLLMLAGPIDLDELDRWMRIGWERRRGADIPYGQGFSGT